MLKTIIGALALTATLPAVASDSRVVRYDDLNLASPAGQQRLQQRIHSAARQVCGAGFEFQRSLIMSTKTQRCLAEAKARAMAQLAQREAANARGG